MQKRRRIAAAGAGVLAAAGLAAGVGSADAARSAPKSVKLFVRGGTTYKIGKYAQENMRYAPTTLTVRSGGTLTIVNKDPSGMEPHTFSIVKRSQLPRSNGKITACSNLAAGSICRDVAVSHGVNPNSPPQGPPPKLVVDVGATGIDQPGDSVFLGPGFPPQTLKITAKPGTTLYYMCVVHPWMQGSIKVVK